MSGFEDLDLVGVATAIEHRQFSSEEVTRWSLDRLETLGRQFNAVFSINHDAAIERARALDAMQAKGEYFGPLHGVPLAHKAMFDVAGQENHGGTQVLVGRVAASTAFVIDQLDKAGQVPLASLHMSEFALSPTGYNAHYGSGKNPWNEAHISGGSSSGSAIAVATRAVFGSLGGDTGGSIRLPAAMCGVTGIKPTFKRISTRGALAVSFSMDCVGPIAQSARDCARLLTCISAPDQNDTLSRQLPAQDYEEQLDGKIKGLRIGVLEDYFRRDVHADVLACVDAALDQFKQSGARIVKASTPSFVEDLNVLSQLVLSVEAATLHRGWLEISAEKYSEQVRARIEQGYFYPAVRYAEALCLREKLVNEFISTAFASCDVLCTPMTPSVTPTIAQTTEGDAASIQRMIASIGQFARGFNYLGLPAISVPAGLSARGLPIAFQLIGKPYEEAVLLKVADAYQRECDWHRVNPVKQLTTGLNS